MTITELLSIPPAELAKLSDEELTVKLAPLIPLARAPYANKKSAKVSIRPGQVVTVKHIEQKAQMIETLLKLNRK